jgi:hypothetical protein
MRSYCLSMRSFQACLSGALLKTSLAILGQKQQSGTLPDKKDD